MARYIRLKEALSSQEKKLKFAMWKEIRRQDAGKEKPCPLGAKLQECELIELMLSSMDRDENLATLVMHGDLIPHMVTWHYKELEYLVVEEIVDVQKRR